MRNKELERVYEKNFQNAWNFPRNFQFGYCVSSNNLSASIEKWKQS